MVRRLALSLTFIALAAAVTARAETSFTADAATAQPPAASPAPTPVRYWPVVTGLAQALEISNDHTSRPLRRFNAPRPAVHADNPTRRHVGVDLFAAPGDTVIAVEDGRVLGFYPFLRAATGEMSYALLVDHGAYVANYGEVRQNSLTAHGLAIGDRISAGQPIATISDTAQLHFETYQAGTQHSSSWPNGAPQPAGVRDPTAFLTALAEQGARRMPGDTTTVQAASLAR